VTRNAKSKYYPKNHIFGNTFGEWVGLVQYHAYPAAQVHGIGIAMQEIQFVQMEAQKTLAKKNHRHRIVQTRASQSGKFGTDRTEVGRSC